MSVPPPLGYGIAAFYFSLTGSSKQFVNTFGYANPGGLGVAAVLSAFRTNFCGTGAIYNAAYYNNQCHRTKIYVLDAQSSGTYSAEDLTSVVGTSTFSSPSPNVSGVVRKSTIYAGRAYRGRVALPSTFIDEADVDDDGTIGSSRTAYQTALLLSFGLTLASNLPLYLLHGPNLVHVTPAPTPITALTYEPMVGTMRKRIKR